ncbi:MAG TPA: hypothetical protein VFU06_12030 [Longimicrobiales bacterium]|nr:hypothetical protein [Longimicrobiales bacterium]
MPDERQDSIRQGIGAPDESEIGQAAREKRRLRDRETPPMDSAMGGTSDVDSPADEAQERAARRESERDGASRKSK